LATLLTLQYRYYDRRDVNHNRVASSKYLMIEGLNKHALSRSSCDDGNRSPKNDFITKNHPSRRTFATWLFCREILFYSPSPGPTCCVCVVLYFHSVIDIVGCAASWLFCRLLGIRRQLQEAPEREFEDLPLVTPDTRHAPRVCSFPVGVF
jgi:hypothetical protein